MNFLRRSFHSFPKQMQKLYVGNIAWTATEEQLRQPFAKFGSILDVFIVRDRLTGRSRGFAFVEFANKQDAEKAKEELDGTTLQGRVLKVNLAVDRERKTFNNEF
ncbi:hypothetical protein HDV06_006769 [Boothiomyces sp. JEL0866]|nr:hypothetical protein HDV06_006769 [Boothiomyces sp. JEL0866]